MSDLIQRLRCKYPIGPIMENGEPEFGWRDMSGPVEGVVLPTPIDLEAANEIERLQVDGKNLRLLISQFDAAIRRVAAELTTEACGGVDVGDNINYGPGGHTGWLLAAEARRLKAENAALKGLAG